jgi:hypothetical protein
MHNFPHLVLFKGHEPSWQLYNTFAEFTEGPHAEILHEDDPTVSVLFAQRVGGVVFATFTNLTEAYVLADRAYDLIPKGVKARMHGYPRNWSSSDAVEWVNHFHDRGDFRFMLNIGGQFTLTKEYHHLYPK